MYHFEDCLLWMDISAVCCLCCARNVPEAVPRVASESLHEVMRICIKFTVQSVGFSFLMFSKILVFISVPFMRNKHHILKKELSSTADGSATTYNWGASY
jgi:hypothetical protein